MRVRRESKASIAVAKYLSIAAVISMCLTAYVVLASATTESINYPENPITTGSMTVYGKARSLVYMDFAPSTDGSWWAKVEDNGLAGVTIKVYDVSGSAPVKLLAKGIQFDGDRYATKYTPIVPVYGGKNYRMTGESVGKYAGSALVTGLFKSSVNLNPVAVISSPQSVFVGQPVVFDGTSSYDPDGTVVKWSWSFGDNTVGDGQMVTHIYYLQGDCSVSLRVTDNAGAEGVASVTVSCIPTNPGTGSWSSPVSIGASMDEIYSGPSVSMNSHGQAIAGWSSRQGSEWQLWANRFVAGLGWQGPESIGPAMPWTYAPAVGIDDNGISTVAWIVDNTIYTRRYVPTYGWDAAIVVSNAVTYPSGLTLAVDPDGKAVLAWEAQVDLHWGILASVRGVGNDWSVPTLIESSRGQADNPCAVISNGGKAIVAFSIYGGSQCDVWANSYTPGVGWLGETLLEDLGQYSSGPKVSMDAYGNAFAVWDYQTASNYVYTHTVYANRYVGGVWQGAVRIEPESASAPMSPDVCAYGFGNAAVVWTVRTEPLPAGEIRTSTHLDGVGWSSPESVGTGSLYVLYPSVAVDSSGNIYVGWSQSDGLGNVDGYVILTNNFSPGLGWSGPQTLMWVRNTYGPMVAAGPSNIAVMVWDEFGAPLGVWASDYAVRTA
jgi:hypothetical protein